MKILVVDDSKAMRMIVIKTLKQAELGSLKTVQAGSGVEALEVIKSDPPDLILSDWNMPEMKGIDLLKNVREMGIETPFGFITSESSTEAKQQALDAGANFLITKPFNAESMTNALNSVLA